MNYTRADAEAALWLLVEKYPVCFFMLEAKRRPLEIGIYDKIVAANFIEPDKLKLALQCYCRSEGYLRALARGGARIGLAGEPVGVVSPAHATDATKGLAARLARKKARREAEEQPACSGVGGSVQVKPKRIGLADLRAAVLARRA